MKVLQLLLLMEAVSLAFSVCVPCLRAFAAD